MSAPYVVRRRLDDPQYADQALALVCLLLNDACSRYARDRRRVGFGSCLPPGCRVCALGYLFDIGSHSRVTSSYPFIQDEDCKRLFRLYLAVSHGSRMVRRVSSAALV